MLINFKEKCVFWVLLKSIHSLLLITYPSGDRTKSGVHLDRSSVCRWAHTDRHTQTLTPLPACVWTVGGSWSNPRQPTLWSDGGFEPSSSFRTTDSTQGFQRDPWALSHNCFYCWTWFSCRHFDSTWNIDHRYVHKTPPWNLHIQFSLNAPRRPRATLKLKLKSNNKCIAKISPCPVVWFIIRYCFLTLFFKVCFDIGLTMKVKVH